MRATRSAFSIRSAYFSEDQHGNAIAAVVDFIEVLRHGIGDGIPGGRLWIQLRAREGACARGV